MNEDEIGIGHNLPPREHNRAPEQEIEPVLIDGPLPIERFPEKYGAAIRDNEKLNACCRQVEQHSCFVYASPSASEDRLGNIMPDIFIAVCNCGRKHRRVVLGGARMGG